MTFTLVVSKAAHATFRRLDRTLQRRLLAHFDELIANPFAASVVLEGAAPLRRSRVGQWRVLFQVNLGERVVHIDAIRPRGQAYRNLPE